MHQKATIKNEESGVISVILSHKKISRNNLTPLDSQETCVYVGIIILRFVHCIRKCIKNKITSLFIAQNLPKPGNEGS